VNIIYNCSFGLVVCVQVAVGELTQQLDMMLYSAGEAAIDSGLAND